MEARESVTVLMALSKMFKAACEPEAVAKWTLDTPALSAAVAAFAPAVLPTAAAPVPPKVMPAGELDCKVKVP